MYRLARVDQESLAELPGAANEARRNLTATMNRIGALLWQTGKPAEAEAEFRKALAIRQKLADDNPAVTEFRSALARATSISASSSPRRASCRRRRPGTGTPWRSGRSWPTTTPPSPYFAATWR